MGTDGKCVYRGSVLKNDTEEHNNVVCVMNEEVC